MWTWQPRRSVGHARAAPRGIGGSGGCRRRLAAGGARATGHARPPREPASAAKHVIFLTCDAFGVLPPVSRLTPEQAEYHFISGYTAKVAGTEVGVTEPQATFSPCFGGPFLVWHPGKYASLLSKKIVGHGVSVWLVNTGWSGGPYGVGRRIKLANTRAILDAIHAGALTHAPTEREPFFGLHVVTGCPNVSQDILVPKSTWSDPGSYDEAATKLATLFRNNFRAYADGVREAVRVAGPA